MPDSCESQRVHEHRRRGDHTNVFHYYNSSEAFNDAGIFKDGFDIGVDLSFLSVNINSEENLCERMKSPYA